MQTINKWILLLILSSLIFSCKKYEEGPIISFRSAEKRIEGEWSLKELNINDQDSLSVFYNYDNGRTFQFINDSDKQHLLIRFSDGWTDQASWSLNKHKNKISIYMMQGSFIEPIYCPLQSSWSINSLYRDEIKLQADISGLVYKLRFSK